MPVVIWVAENTWQACVDAALSLAPPVPGAWVKTSASSSTTCRARSCSSGPGHRRPYRPRRGPAGPRIRHPRMRTSLRARTHRLRASRCRPGWQPSSRQHEPMPAQAATVSLAVQLAPAVLKPNFRLATVPHPLLSSTLLQLPSVNLHWKLAQRDSGEREGPGVGAGLGHRVVGGHPVVGGRDPGAEDVRVARQADRVAARGIPRYRQDERATGSARFRPGRASRRPAPRGPDPRGVRLGLISNRGVGDHAAADGVDRGAGRGPQVRAGGTRHGRGRDLVQQVDELLHRADEITGSQVG